MISAGFEFDRAIAASNALFDYFSAIIAERRKHPSDDVISVLVQAELDGERLDDAQICSFLRLLLPAGAETTYRSSSNLLFGLLTNPDQLDALPRRPRRSCRRRSRRACAGSRRCSASCAPRRVTPRSTAWPSRPARSSPSTSARPTTTSATGTNAEELRHLPPAAPAHRVRVGPAHVPRPAPGAHGDAGRAQPDPRSAARTCASTPTPSRRSSPARCSARRTRSRSSGTEATDRRTLTPTSGSIRRGMRCASKTWSSSVSTITWWSRPTSSRAASPRSTPTSRRSSSARTAASTCGSSWAPSSPTSGSTRSRAARPRSTRWTRSRSTTCGPVATTSTTASRT